MNLSRISFNKIRSLHFLLRMLLYTVTLRISKIRSTRLQARTRFLMSTHSNAHANAKKWIFDVQFPGHWFEFGIMGDDFWSRTVWVFQIQVLFAWFKNPKIPGIQPTDELRNQSNQKSLLNQSVKQWSEVVKKMFKRKRHLRRWFG